MDGRHHRGRGGTLLLNNLKFIRDVISMLPATQSSKRAAQLAASKAMTRMVEDIVVKMQQELLQERKEREQVGI